MRKGVQLVSVALLAGLGWAALVGQVTPTNRPAPIKITAAQVSPGTANTVSGDGRAEARIAELEGRLASLEAELKAQKNALASTQNALKTTSLKGFENAGKLSKLSQDYYSHDHIQNFLSVSNNFKTGDVSTSLGTMVISPPRHTCKLLPTPAVNKTWEHKYSCTPPQ